MKTHISGPRKTSELLPMDSLTLKTLRTPREYNTGLQNTWRKV